MSNENTREKCPNCKGKGATTRNTGTGKTEGPYGICSACKGSGYVQAQNLEAGERAVKWMEKGCPPNFTLEAQAPSNSGVYGGSHVCRECGKPIINGMVCDHKEPPLRKVKNMSKKLDHTPGNWAVLAALDAIPLATFQYEEWAICWRDKMCQTGIVTAIPPIAASTVSKEEDWPKLPTLSDDAHSEILQKEGEASCPNCKGTGLRCGACLGTGKVLKEGFEEGFEEGLERGRALAENLRKEALTEHARGESLTTLAATSPKPEGTSLQEVYKKVTNSIFLPTEKGLQAVADHAVMENAEKMSITQSQLDNNDATFYQMQTALRQQLAHAQARAEKAENTIQTLEQQVTEQEEIIIKLEKDAERLAEALQSLYEKESYLTTIQEYQDEANEWKAEGDGYGWNFFQGMYMGVVHWEIMNGAIIK